MPVSYTHLVNLGDEIIKKDRIRLKFTAELSYCTEVAQKVKTFLEGEVAKDTLLGIGVAIPGIIAVSYTHLDVYKRQAPVYIKNIRGLGYIWNQEVRQ